MIFNIQHYSQRKPSAFSIVMAKNFLLKYMYAEHPQTTNIRIQQTIDHLYQLADAILSHYGNDNKLNDSSDKEIFQIKEFTQSTQPQQMIQPKKQTTNEPSQKVKKTQKTYERSIRRLAQNYRTGIAYEKGFSKSQTRSRSKQNKNEQIPSLSQNSLRKKKHQQRETFFQKTPIQVLSIQSTKNESFLQLTPKKPILTEMPQHNVNKSNSEDKARTFLELFQKGNNPKQLNLKPLIQIQDIGQHYIPIRVGDNFEFLQNTNTCSQSQSVQQSYITTTPKKQLPDYLSPFKFPITLKNNQSESPKKLRFPKLPSHNEFKEIFKPNQTYSQKVTINQPNILDDWIEPNKDEIFRTNPHKANQPHPSKQIKSNNEKNTPIKKPSVQVNNSKNTADSVKVSPPQNNKDQHTSPNIQHTLTNQTSKKGKQNVLISSSKHITAQQSLNISKNEPKLLSSQKLPKGVTTSVTQETSNKFNLLLKQGQSVLLECEGGDTFRKQSQKATPQASSRSVSSSLRSSDSDSEDEEQMAKTTFKIQVYNQETKQITEQKFTKDEYDVVMKSIEKNLPVGDDVKITSERRTTRLSVKPGSMSQSMHRMSNPNAQSRHGSRVSQLGSRMSQTTHILAVHASESHNEPKSPVSQLSASQPEDDSHDVTLEQNFSDYIIEERDEDDEMDSSRVQVQPPPPIINLTPPPAKKSSQLSAKMSAIQSQLNSILLGLPPPKVMNPELEPETHDHVETMYRRSTVARKSRSTRAEFGLDFQSDKQQSPRKSIFSQLQF